MKYFLRNLLIIFSYLTSAMFWRRLFLNKPLLRVWCLHEIKDDQVAAFEQKIIWLKKNYNFISPVQFKNSQLAKDKINILLTFDDGYLSWFKNVLPILSKHGLTAIFFITYEFRCHESKLLVGGHFLGGHSVTHARLTRISSEQLDEELQKSVKSDFFAYPFGDKKSFNQSVINKVRQLGYKWAFTILPGFNNVKTDLLLLHRDSLDPDMPMLIFKLWLKGGYDWWKKVF